MAAFASAPNKTKGVAIIIDKKFKISIVDKGSDQEGRIAFLKCIYNGIKIALVSVYALNCYEPNFFHSLTNILMELTDQGIIREFTFYSSRHRSFSRIDFILISSSLFSSVKN